MGPGHRRRSRAIGAHPKGRSQRRRGHIGEAHVIDGFVDRVDQQLVSSELTFRVPDCQTAYDAITIRGAQFITPPMTQNWGGEIRCFLRDPDGHLLEFSQLL